MGLTELIGTGSWEQTTLCSEGTSPATGHSCVCVFSPSLLSQNYGVRHVSSAQAGDIQHLPG